MSYFDQEEEEKKFTEKHRSCDGLRQEFIDCITKSDCFLKVNLFCNFVSHGYHWYWTMKSEKSDITGIQGAVGDRLSEKEG